LPLLFHNIQPKVFSVKAAAMSLVEEITSLAKAPITWLSSTMNRQRLRGARIEVVILLIARRPQPRILFVQSYYNDCWMPPQEGVELKEGLRDALARGLAEECGIDMRHEDGSYNQDFYVRQITFLKTLDLPPERIDERQIAADVEDTPFHAITMKKKAYWLGIVLIESAEQVLPKPALNEIKAIEWLSFESAAEKIIATNRPEKAELLSAALAQGMRHLDAREFAAH
jgi:ADP-ribose pyrophosphatase YjhB (NUDIX family)